MITRNLITEKILLLSKQGDLAGLEAAFQSLKTKPNFAQDHYKLVLNALCNGGMHRQVASIYSQMRALPNLCINPILTSLGTLNEFERLENVLQSTRIDSSGLMALLKGLTTTPTKEGVDIGRKYLFEYYADQLKRDPKHFDLILGAYAELQTLVRMAPRLIKKVEVQDFESNRSLMYSLGSVFSSKLDVSKLQRFFDSLVGDNIPSMDSLQYLLVAIGVSGNYAHFKCAWDATRKLGLSPRPDSYTFALKLFLENKDYESMNVAANEILSEKKGVNASALNYLISAHVKQGRSFEKIYLLFQKMVAIGVLPNSITYNNLLRCYGKYNVKEAEALFVEMVEKGHLPDAVTYISLMRIYEQAENIEAMEKLLTKATDAGISNVKIYDAVISAHAINLDLNSMKKVCKERLKKFPADIPLLLVVTNACIKKQDYQENAYMVSYLKNHGLETSINLFNAEIQAFALTRNILVMNKKITEMVSKGYKPNSETYKILLAFHSTSAMRGKELGRLVFEINSVSLTSTVNESIVQAYANVKDIKNVQHHFRPSAHYRSSLYILILEALESLKLHDHPLRLVVNQKLVDLRIRHDTRKESERKADTELKQISRNHKESERKKLKEAADKEGEVEVEFEETREQKANEEAVKDTEANAACKETEQEGEQIASTLVQEKLDEEAEQKVQEIADKEVKAKEAEKDVEFIKVQSDKEAEQKVEKITDRLSELIESSEIEERKADKESAEEISKENIKETELVESKEISDKEVQQISNKDAVKELAGNITEKS